MEIKNTKVVVVGAGLVGTLVSIFLSRQGVSSTLIERRKDLRRELTGGGRSINLAISTRGLSALREVGLEQEVLTQALPMKGRMIHSLTGDLHFQPYGAKDSDCIYSLSRTVLNQILLTAAEKTGNISIRFHQKVLNLDLTKPQIWMRDEATGDTSTLVPDIIIGADGSYSIVRNELKNCIAMEHSQESPDYAYKELLLPSRPGGGSFFDPTALHIWPRGNYMLIALPNLDGSFTCTLFLPYFGSTSFDSLKSADEVNTFFNQQFSDITPLFPSLTETFLSSPVGSMLTLKCSPWHYQGKALLIGDAAHAILPFFGQGMNCGFEDCSVLNQLFKTESSWENIFSKFSSLRKSQADAIADMACENFVEMRDKVALPRFHLEKAVEKVLLEKFPGSYYSRYSLVTFSNRPYRFAHAVGRVTDQILVELCADIESASQVDLRRAETLIQSRLSPLFDAENSPDSPFRIPFVS